MPESAPNLSLSPRLLAVLSGTAILLSGCSLATHKDADLAGHATLPRCFKEPIADYNDKNLKYPARPIIKKDESLFQYKEQTVKWQKAIHKYYDSLYGELPAKVLRLPVHKGLVQGDPIYSSSVNKKVTSSLVEIENNEWKGTGFLVKDKKGHEVVLTAAHVVGDTKLRDLLITANDGQMTHPTGGCYVFDNGGRHENLAKHGEAVVSDDIAMLRLAKPIGRSVLKIAGSETKRGSWNYFVNYQADHGPGDPAFYNGILAVNSRNVLGMSYVTGLDAYSGASFREQNEDYSIEAGASGGPVVNSQSRVEAISTSADLYSTYQGPSELKYTFGLTFPGAQYGETGEFLPRVAGTMPLSLIRRVLDSRHG